MQLHQLKPNHARKKEKRIGRGGKRGTYSGKGIKGQSKRAGRKFQPLVRLIIKKYPKKRGYRFKSLKNKPEIINLSCLDAKFDKNSIISPQTLVEKGLVRKKRGKMPEVKILGTGEIKKTFTFKNCLISEAAEEKIIKIGGTIDYKQKEAKPKKEKIKKEAKPKKEKIKKEAKPKKEKIKKE